jgi:DNA mismatch repair ATPase MutS
MFVAALITHLNCLFFPSSTSAHLLSTCESDMAQVSYIIRHANVNSLCLIDEFGKGTSSIDGVALIPG